MIDTLLPFASSQVSRTKLQKLKAKVGSQRRKVRAAPEMSRASGRRRRAARSQAWAKVNDLGRLRVRLRAHARAVSG